jgi:hypothetical protein
MLAPVIGLILFNHYCAVPLKGFYFLVVLSVFCIISILLPAYFVYSLKRNGAISSYEMESLSDRRWPMIFSSALLCFNVFLMHRAQAGVELQGYFLMTATAALIASVISQFYKISLHTLGVGFIFGILLFLSSHGASDLRSAMILVALIAGIIGSSRLYLGVHDKAQVYLGFITGILPAAGMIWFTS